MPTSRVLDSADPRSPSPARDDSRVQAPSVALPKGGGALRGIGETFTVNPLNGTSAITVPLAISAGRSGFAPPLSLTYDSGAGNGPFGLGWSLSVPAISRKTEKTLPRYLDGNESDIFVLAGVEDLVPVLTDAGTRHLEWIDGYRVQRYRPRIEAGFARIERWTSATGETHWRSISRENVTTFFGRTPNSRIADPADGTRVFRWLVDEMRDDRGNVIAYEYKAEDFQRVDVSGPHEGHRSPSSVSAGRYLKRVSYGNQTPHQADGWHFHAVFDYGEHDLSKPTLDEDTAWPSRTDPFSTYRPGFDVRTYRLCRRVLMFHVFDALAATPCLVRSTDFVYAGHAAATLLAAVTHSGYVRHGKSYQKQSLPALELGYTASAVDQQVHIARSDAIEQLPVGVDGASFRWTDLDSEALTGVLTAQGGAWLYSRNRGGGAFDAPEVVAAIPSPSDFRSGCRLLDLANEGRKSLVQFDGPVAGYRDRAPDGTWQPFTAFASLPAISLEDPNVRLIDVDGDGLADLVMTEDDVLSWYPSLGKAGFGPRAAADKPRDEERGAALVFADAGQSVYTADMSGDGLVDIVRIRNGEICYWPNLGYGRFGAKIVMADAPVFDAPDQFNQTRLRLVDVDGSGTTDVIYLGRDEVRFWINQSGNRWSPAQTLSTFPDTDDLASVAAVDLLGNGTACLVWSSPSPRDAGRPLRYIDLTSGIKPHLLASVVNNLGAETRLQYAPSTKFYLADRAAGQPWATRLSFVVHVVEQVDTLDRITGNRFVATYRYRHGYYDAHDREFRGFGYVEQTDAETYAPFHGSGEFAQGAGGGDPLDVPPVVTKTWVHTGAFVDGAGISAKYRQEYYGGDAHPQAAALDDPALPPGLGTEEQIEACRALKGRVLRREVYAQDATAERAHPYSVSESTFEVRRLQPRGANRHAVFLAHACEAAAYHYERNPADPRVSHEITLAVDDFGNVTRSVSVGYPRRSPLFPEQAKTTIVYTEHDVFNAPPGAGWHRVGVPIETRTFEVTLAKTPPAGLFGRSEIDQEIAAATSVAYEAQPAPGTKRLIGRTRQSYYSDDLAGPLAQGQVESLALPYEAHHLALTPGLVTAVYGTRVTDAMLETDGGYVQYDGAWWLRSGRRIFSAAQFYAPVKFLDPFGNIAGATYDKYALLVTRTDSSLNHSGLNNIVRATNDYRTLGPVRVTDPNGNQTAVHVDALGMVTATAVMGKPGTHEGDTITAPTTRFEYDLFQWMAHGKPAVARGFAREEHRHPQTRWLESHEYSDGFGRVIQKKVQAEPEAGSSAARWVGTGRVVFNNKGKPIKQYEPFFSATPEYEDEAALVMTGVTPVLHYDPAGRVVRTDLPNGTFSATAFDPWQQTTADPNDTVSDSVWYSERKNLSAADPEGRAAALAAKHAGTPAVTHLDALGRTFLAIADNGPQGQYRTHTTLDIQNNPLVVADHFDRAVVTHRFDAVGRQLYVNSMDASERWTLLDAAGRTIRTWDSRGHATRTAFDPLGRRTHVYLQTDGGAEVLVERTLYGEAVAKSTTLNLRGRVFEQYDGAGRSRNDAFDFKGNVAAHSRRFAKDYTQTVNWSALATLTTAASVAKKAEARLEAEVFGVQTSFDALNRPVSVTTPDQSEARPRYNEATLLDGVSVRLRGDVQATECVSNIDYDAKGQRTLLAYGNGVHTEYEYDTKTFRLTRLHTLRGVDALQDLSYTFDPVGNVTAIRDEAQQTVYFKNAVVSPGAQYEYDAIYRLTVASGREHRGQGGQSSLVVAHDDSPRMNQPNPNDGQAMRPYTETYEYDEVGNIQTVVRVADQQSWTQRHRYASDSNRLLSTSAPSDPADQPLPVRYTYNAHGSMTGMPHLKQIDWDHREQMVRVDLGGGGTAYYTYDAAGQRARKVIERQGGLVQERLYVGPYEIYRERQNGVVTLARETLHVMDDTRRIAIVETKTIDNGVAIQLPTPLIRYQLGNHLGSASLELDADGAIVSYEEYYPYGSTSYQAGASAAEVSLKRYRYTGKERDEETSLEYHGARYYAPWLGRWTASDPAGTVDGVNLYLYVRAAPLVLNDPTGRDGNYTFRDFAQDLDRGTNLFISIAAPGSIVVREAGEFVGSVIGHAIKGDLKTVPVSTDYMTPGVGSIAIASDRVQQAADSLALATYSGEHGPSIGDRLRAGVDATQALLSAGAHLATAFLPGLAREAHSPVRAVSGPEPTLEPPPPAPRLGVEPLPTAAAPEPTPEPTGPEPKTSGERWTPSDVPSYRRPLTKADPVHLELYSDVLDADEVAIGRTGTSAKPGHLIAGLDIGESSALVLDKWLDQRFGPGKGWTPDFQAVFNRALFDRAALGRPVRVMAGGPFTELEVNAAEAGAKKSGVNNLPYWPPLREGQSWRITKDSPITRELLDASSK